MILPVLGSLAFLIGGVLAYTGRWQRWAVTTRLGAYAVGFSLLYFGLAGVCAAIFFALRGTPFLPVGVAFLIVCVPAALVAVLSIFWLPRFLLPRWFKDYRRSGS